jgi:hypothetical protein
MTFTFTGLLAAATLNVLAAGPAAAIPGLGNISVATAVDSNVFKAATAMCPAGQVVIGGGARLTLSTGEVSITRMAPNATANGYEAWAYEDADGFAGVWGLVVTAICAPAPAGYVIVTATSPMGSPATASVVAACPAGRQVLGTGGAVNPGRGVVLLTGVVPAPAAAPTSVTASGAEIAGGFGGGWTVQSWAICAGPVAGQTVVITTSAFDSTSPKSQTSGCPTGLSVHGVGFQFGGGTGEIFLNAAFPNPTAPVGTSVPVTASEDQSGFLGNWSIRTFASCAP